VNTLLYWLDKIQLSERSLVGDKAFYLSQQAQAGRAVVPGFAIAASALREFLSTYEWSEPFLGELLTSTLHVNVDNVYQLQGLAQHIREEIYAAELPDAWVNELKTAVDQLNAPVLIFRPSLVPPVQGSEILIGQVSGLLESRVCTNHRDALTQTWKQTWAELFTARSLFFWQRSGIRLKNLNLAILVQPVWNAIAAGSLKTGVDGWEIQSTWGLGMSISAGKTIPDIYQINPETGQVQEKILGNKLIAYNLAVKDSEKLNIFLDESAVDSSHKKLLETPLKAETSISSNLDFCQCIQPFLLTDPQQQLYSLPKPYFSELIKLTGSLVREFNYYLYLKWLVCLESNGDYSEFLDKTSYTSMADPLKQGGVRGINVLLDQNVEAKHSGDNLSDQTIDFMSAGTAKQTDRTSQNLPNAQVYLTEISLLNHLPPKAKLIRPLVSPVKKLPKHQPKNLLLEGLGAAPGEAIAPAFVISDPSNLPEKIIPGTIVVTKTINVDTLFCLKQAIGIIAEQGGMTSHAAILARELGIPAVVSAAGAIGKIQTNQRLLINGDKGLIYQINDDDPENLDQIEDAKTGNLEKFDSSVAPIATQLMVNLSQPQSLDKISQVPVDGVGLLRSEMMMLDILDRQHPQQWIEAGRQQELVELMSDRLRQIAQSMFPRPVFYRAADLKSDDYPAQEPETNPALGLHGAFSYLLDSSLFELELAVLDRVQTDGLNNVNLILPFVRSVDEFVFCRQRVEQTGLNRVSEFQLWIMAEVPSVVFLLEEYIQAGVQGIAIGTNDLTQLLLGADRNQVHFKTMFAGSHPAVISAIGQLMSTAQKFSLPTLFYAHNPALDYKLIDRLVRWGVTGISVEPIVLAKMYQAIARSEKRLLLEAARQSLNRHP
jgi:pyruvate,water dikinase